MDDARERMREADWLTARNRDFQPSRPLGSMPTLELSYPVEATCSQCGHVTQHTGVPLKPGVPFTLGLICRGCGRHAEVSLGTSYRLKKENTFGSGFKIHADKAVP
jgi:hypothetical protein